MTHPLAIPLHHEAKVDNLHREAANMLAELAKLLPRHRLSLVAREPAFPDGRRDMFLSEDTIPEVMAALRQLEQTPTRRHPDDRGSDV